MKCRKVWASRHYGLADVYAENMSRVFGHRMKAYFCRQCELYHIAHYQSGNRVNGATKKARRKLRPQIDVWESEGGSILYP